MLDRAFTLELNTIDLDGLAGGIVRGGDLDLDRWNGRLDHRKRQAKATGSGSSSRRMVLLPTKLRRSMSCCQITPGTLGYRVATEVARFVKLAVEQSTDPPAAARGAVDVALLEKVLVKLHGTRQELGSILDGLLVLALLGADKKGTLFDPAGWSYRADEGIVVPKNELADADAVFPRSAAKLWRMCQRLRETGFTSWIE